MLDALWELTAVVILVGSNADEPRPAMPLVEAERLQVLPMAHSHRAVARVQLPLPKFRIRPGTRLRTAGYVERLWRSR